MAKTHYIVNDVHRLVNPDEDHTDTLGATTSADEARRLAMKATGEARVLAHEPDGRVFDHTAREYDESDLMNAQQAAEKAGRQIPNSLDPWHGLTERARALEAGETKRRYPGVRTKKPPKSKTVKSRG